MARGAASALRLRLTNAVNLLRSGGVMEYGTIMDIEAHGEDSPEMRFCHDVLIELGVTDEDLERWMESFLEEAAHQCFEEAHPNPYPRHTA